MSGRRRRRVLGGPNALRAARGAGSRTRHGYRVITVNGRQVLEHRYVMEQHLGRPLRKGETVHHRDGNRSRNTIDNLELWTGAQPSGQRAADLLAWAEEIVARYGPERHLLWRWNSAARPAEPNAPMPIVANSLR